MKAEPTPNEKEKLLAKNVEMAGLVSYQENSVISRQIISQKGGNVTLFAFDRGQGLSEHTSPFDALVYVLEGEPEIMIDRKPVRVKAGEMVIMPANHPHAVRAVEKFKMLLVLIKS